MVKRIVTIFILFMIILTSISGCLNDDKNGANKKENNDPGYGELSENLRYKKIYISTADIVYQDLLPGMRNRILNTISNNTIVISPDDKDYRGLLYHNIQFKFKHINTTDHDMSITHTSPTTVMTYGVCTYNETDSGQAVKFTIRVGFYGESEKSDENWYDAQKYRDKYLANITLDTEYFNDIIFEQFGINYSRVDYGSFESGIYEGRGFDPIINNNKDDVVIEIEDA